MKAKICWVSILSGVLLLMFSAGAWADSRKDRSHRKHYKKNHHREIHHHYHWDAADRRHLKKQRQHHRIKRHRWAHDHQSRYRPRHGHYYRYRPWHRHDYQDHRPLKKYRHHKHRRPLYKYNDGNVSVRASASDHGWSIRISSRDRKRVR